MRKFAAMTLDERLEHYPAVSDLRKIARRRIPHFAWEYLESGTGREIAVQRNRDALDAISFQPAGLRGDRQPDLATSIFGRTYDIPVGIAPVGMTGMMWPGGEIMLAEGARDRNIPFCLSTVACETVEDVGKAAGGNAWFQLYTFGDRGINLDLLKRARDSGCSAAMVTIDLPVASMRERQRRAGLRMPPAVTPKFIANVAVRPAWALATRKRGKPSFRNLENYANSADMREITRFMASSRMGGSALWDDVKRFRDVWDGPLIMKGVMSAEDANNALEIGADGIVVSNHGGRQFDGSPASISVLPEISKTVGGRMAVLFDSGVSTGLDVMRAIALGADFVLCGRAYVHGVAAFERAGGEHVTDILKADLANNMQQLGVRDIAGLRQLQPYC